MKKVPFSHFAFSGVNDIYMDTDKNNIHRYYLRTIFDAYPKAEAVKGALVVRGFKQAEIIPIEVEEKKRMSTYKQFSRTVYYPFDSYELSAKAKMTIDELLQSLPAQPDVNIAIIGHSDSKGNADYNIQLSKNRVRAIKQYLLAKGVSKNKIIARACGESNPQMPNVCKKGKDLIEHRKQNRRAVILVFNRLGEVIIEQVPTEQTVRSVLGREMMKK